MIQQTADDKVTLLKDGFVRLVDSMGSDLSVVRAARVSYDAAWRAGEDQGSDNRLLNYLWKHHHTTPFEAVTFTFEVKAPIFVFRHWHRHRTQSYNESSARYCELPEEFYIPEPHMVGRQSKASKQARDIDIPDDTLLDKRAYECYKLDAYLRQGFELYHELLDSEWPKELARLPLSVATHSHMFATMNLLNLMKWLTLRCHPHAQYEIRVYAEAIVELIRPIVPVCVAAWESSRKASEQAEAAIIALRKCLALAQREVSKDYTDENLFAIIQFCHEAGISS